MPTYKRKADLVEAEMFDGTPTHLVTSEVKRVNEVLSFVFHLHTPDGPILVREGDYIVTTQTGQRYVCPAELFEEFYEPTGASTNLVDSQVDRVRKIEDEVQRNAGF